MMECNTNLNNYKIILGSHSPRRKELLEKTGLKFIVKSSDVKEDFKKFHDLEVNELDGLAIMADTDNSKMKSISYFQNIYFSAD